MAGKPRNTTHPRANDAEEAAKFYLPIYLGLGTTRSVKRVHELARAVGIRVSVGTIARYSSIGNWVAAAKAFDSERAAEGQHISIDQIMASELRQVQLGRLLQETAIAEVAKRHGLGDRLAPEGLSGIARIADVGVKIERLGSGQATEIREVLVGVYQVFLVEAANLWLAGQRAQQAIYAAAGIVDAGLHARAQNAAGEIFGPGMDDLVQQNFRQWGVADIVFGGDPPGVEEREDE